MSSAARTSLAVVVGVPVLIAAAVLFSPFSLLAGYGLDAAIGQRTGCSIGTLEAAISVHGPNLQVAVLVGRWLIAFASIGASSWWLLSMVLMAFYGANEASHQMGLKQARYATVTVGIVAVSIPLYSQGMCLAS